MKKVLVIDDDKFIRQGIVNIIKNELKNIHVESAINGKEGFEKINCKKYDLVISDIKMPEMDGLELIEKISKLPIRPKIIILSGFDDFEYAKKCMKFQIRNYLLKPVDKHELVESIKETLNIIDKEQEKLKETLIRELKYKLDSKQSKYDNLDNLLEKLNMKFESYKCYFLKKEKIIINKIEDAIYIKNSNNSAYVITNNSNFCFTDFDILIESDFESDLFDAFKSVETLKKYKILFEKKHITPSDIIDREYSLINDDVVIEIHKCLKIGKLEMALQLFGELFSKNKIEKYNYKSFKEIHESLIRNIFYDKNSFDQFNKRFHELEFDNINEYLEEIKTGLRILADNYKKSNTVEIVHIENAKEYIMKNYAKDLNMAVVSNEISLNYSYFSTIFKQYMNTNFSDYLHQVRVEKSKKYLKKSDLKIYEVAEKVGYKSPKHYSRIFKKFEKITPVEFKLKNRKLKPNRAD